MTGQRILVEQRHRWRAPLVIRVPWSYFVTGTYLVSKGDNASFWHDATEDYRGKPVVKLTRARWRRVLRRNAAVTVPLWLAVWTVTPWVPLWVLWAYLAVEAAVGLFYGGRLALNGVAWLGRTWRRRRANTEWVDPAAQVLCRTLNIRYERYKARKMIDLPDGWGAGREDEGAERLTARIIIPVGTPLSAGVKKQVTENVGSRLGIPTPVQGDWREAGAEVSVELAAAPLPPKTVTYDDLRKAIAEAAEDETVVGRKAGSHVVKVSLSEDAPHVLMSGAAGTGKTVLIRVFLRQRLEKGDGVVITDPKRFSHIRWAGKLPKNRVVYAYTDEQLHEAWLAVAAETKRRIALPEEELESQRRVFVVAEELNAQIKILNRYWRKKRQEILRPARAILADAVKAAGGSQVDGLQAALDDGLDQADLDPPQTSPAVVALQEAVFMGRELRMHVIAGAQRASADVFGGSGGNVRESFQGGRFIAKWDRKLWKMLVDTLAYVACPNGPRGLWGLARGDEFEIFRVPWLSEQEMLLAIENAAAVHGPVLGPQTGVATIDGHSEPRAISAAVTLAMAIDQLPGQDGPEALSLAGLRTASNRPGFPPPLARPDGQEYGRTEAKLYWLHELIEWREMAKQINA
jgi:hypothetical protein